MRNKSEGSTEGIQSFEGARPGGTLELTDLLCIILSALLLCENLSVLLR
jgi:hypothetical protein